MIRSFFKLPGYSVFNYQPLYYDPEKERRENRRRQLRLEQGKELEYDNDVSLEERVRGRLKYRIEPVRKAKRVSNIRLILIAAILTFVVYLILVV